MDWLLYGASGFTGSWLAREAARRGLSPVLAGRDPARVRRVAGPLGLPFLVFPAEDADRFVRRGSFRLVLNCAGPFGRTAAPVMDACIGAGVHYLDVSGEIPVFEAALARDARARARAVLLLPGVGFDVAVMESLAVRACALLPDAGSLEFAVAGFADFSSGSVLSGLPVLFGAGRLPAAVRFPFPGGDAWVRPVGLAGVFASRHATGVPNVTMFADLPLPARLGPRVPSPQGFLSRVLPRAVAAFWPEPKPEGRRVRVAMRARGGRGLLLQGTAPHGYPFTVDHALRAVSHVLDVPPPPGFHTPSRVFGPGFVDETPGVSWGRPLWEEGTGPVP